MCESYILVCFSNIFKCIYTTFDYLYHLRLFWTDSMCGTIKKKKNTFRQNHCMRKLLWHQGDVRSSVWLTRLWINFFFLFYGFHGLGGHEISSVHKALYTFNSKGEKYIHLESDFHGRVWSNPIDPWCTHWKRLRPEWGWPRWMPRTPTGPSCGSSVLRGASVACCSPGDLPKTKRWSVMHEVELRNHIGLCMCPI